MVGKQPPALPRISRALLSRYGAEGAGPSLVLGGRSSRSFGTYTEYCMLGPEGVSEAPVWALTVQLIRFRGRERDPPPDGGCVWGP